MFCVDIYTIYDEFSYFGSWSSMCVENSAPVTHVHLRAEAGTQLPGLKQRTRFITHIRHPIRDGGKSMHLHSFNEGITK
jgi:hypothetical protein